MTELLTILVAITMYGMGFLTCGAMLGGTPFWDGVRQGLTVGLWRKK